MKKTAEQKPNKRRLEGIVVSDKMQKTVVVKVESFTRHAKYGKFIGKSKKYKAHDEEGKYKMGDKVTIEETKPISRDKHFVVVA